MSTNIEISSPTNNSTENKTARRGEESHCNFFTNTGLKGIGLLLFMEFIVTFANGFVMRVPKLQYMQEHSKSPSSAYPDVFAQYAPGVSFYIAAVGAGTLFLLYTFAPGATGNAGFSMDTFFLEVYVEHKKEKKKIGDTLCSKAVWMFFVKLLLVWAFQFIAACLVVISSEYVVRGTYNKDQLGFKAFKTRDGISRDDGRAIFSGLLFYIPFVYVFNYIHRIAPNGLTPYATAGHRVLDNLLIACVYFIGIFVLDGLTGDTLNFMTVWAEAILSGEKSNGVYTFFIAQIVGGGLTFLFAFKYYHTPTINEYFNLYKPYSYDEHTKEERNSLLKNDHAKEMDPNSNIQLLNARLSSKIIKPYQNARMNASKSAFTRI